MVSMQGFYAEDACEYLLYLSITAPKAFTMRLNATMVLILPDHKRCIIMHDFVPRIAYCISE